MPYAPCSLRIEERLTRWKHPQKNSQRPGRSLSFPSDLTCVPEESTAKIMWTVSGALLPATLMSVYYFGLRAVWVIAVSIIAAVLSEAAGQKMLKKPVTTITDGSAFLTGLLIALNVPSSVPLYIPAVGSFVAIVITKQLFGGLGFNIFNPALIGRAFILISFPKLMTTYYEPVANVLGMDAKTTATPLGILKEEGMARLLEVFHTHGELYQSLLMGNRAGSLGETATIALLLGAAFLLLKRYITWHIPPVIHRDDRSSHLDIRGKEGLMTGDPVFHMISGGLILGAFFMATDYVTGPSVRSAQVIFGIACGALTALIRLKGGYPEGVMFAILLMNCFAPLLDRRMRSRVFGKAEAKGVKK